MNLALPPLELDYRRSIAGDRRLGIAVLALAAGLFAGAVVYYDGLADDIARHEAELGRLAREHNRPSAASTLSARELAAQLAAAKGVLRQLSLPWGGLFRAVESTDAKTVALLAIQPNAEKRTVLLQGEAKSLEHALDYVRKLEQSGPLANVHLTSHRIEQQDPQKPVRFTLAADWERQP
jgi:hypothetical protein